MQEVRGSTLGRGIFSLFWAVLFCCVSVFNFFFLTFDWFQFIHSDAPLQLHNVLRLTFFYIFVQGMIRE